VPDPPEQVSEGGADELAGKPNQVRVASSDSKAKVGSCAISDGGCRRLWAFAAAQSDRVRQRAEEDPVATHDAMGVGEWFDGREPSGISLAQPLV
jgi:hypothetical protein